MIITQIILTLYRFIFTQISVAIAIYSSLVKSTYNIELFEFDISQFILFQFNSFILPIVTGILFQCNVGAKVKKAGASILKDCSFLSVFFLYVIWSLHDWDLYINGLFEWKVK